MITISVINMEKFHPDYMNKKMWWIKLDTGMLWDSGYSELCEIDQSRFIKFIMIQVKTKKPIPMNPEYLKKFGMKFRKDGRYLSSTTTALVDANLISTTDELGTNSEPTKEVVALPKKDLGRTYTKSKEEKNRIEKIQSVFDHWNIMKIINHKEISKYRSSIESVLKNYTVPEINGSIKNYHYILTNKTFVWSHKWTLKEFLSRGLEKFLTVNDPVGSMQRDKAVQQSKEGNPLSL